MYQVSRQIYWPDGEHMVEIAKGNIDNMGPDCMEHIGEFKDPRDALMEAFSIADSWQKETDIPIHIGAGCTLYAMFELEPSDRESLIKWADQEYESLEKCPFCNEIMEHEVIRYSANGWDGIEYCSSRCADIMAQREYRREIRFKMENVETWFKQIGIWKYTNIESDSDFENIIVVLRFPQFNRTYRIDYYNLESFMFDYIELRPIATRAFLKLIIDSELAY